MTRSKGAAVSGGSTTLTVALQPRTSALSCSVRGGGEAGVEGTATVG